MIEIVFGESACGSLKIAQTYGKGKYRGSAVSVFMRHEDGSVPSSDEMKEAQIQAQEQEHIAWENAIPLGGKSSDVYCFDMALSVGDISDNGIGEQRKNVLKDVYKRQIKNRPQMYLNPYRTRGLPRTLSAIPKDFLTGLQGRKTPDVYKRQIYRYTRILFLLLKIVR